MTDVADNATTTAVLETTTDGGTGTYSGQFETSGDHDWIRVTLKGDKAYSIFLSTQDVGQFDGDSMLTLRDTAGNIVANNDDTSGSLNSFLAFTPTDSGTFFIDVSNVDLGRGAYSLLMTDLGATNVFLSGSQDRVVANLNERIAGAAGDDSISVGVQGFDALGEQGNDSLLGNDRQNILSGGLGNDSLIGGAGDDFLFGDAGDDFLGGGDDDDQLLGGDGLDDLFGGAGNDTLSGGAGDDHLDGGPGDNLLDGGAGNDVLLGGDDDDTFVLADDEGFGDTLTASFGKDTLQVEGSARVILADFSSVTSSIEHWQGNGKAVVGTGTADVFDFSNLLVKSGLPVVDAGAGNDILTGSQFVDSLIGGFGKDTLFGGLGKDIFGFNALRESVSGPNRDQIRDFSHAQGDRIDVSTIDANTHVGGNQAFHFIGSRGFARHEGELRYSGHILQADVNGDGRADLEIHVNAASLHAFDFVL